MDLFSYHSFDSPDGLRIRWAAAEPGRPGPAGTVLILQGRSEFIEKYHMTAQKLVQNGFRVVTLDWRGQGLSGRETGNRHKGYVKTFRDYLADLHLFYDRVLKSHETRVFILAHSMGGHMALRFMHDYPHLVSRAVLTAPMIDLFLPPVLRPLAEYLSAKACRSGHDRSYVPGGKDYEPDRVTFRHNRLSHDPEQFRILHDEIQKNPDLALGGVTWGWLNAAFESIRVIHQPGFAESIPVPVLILGAEKDGVVSFNAQKKFCKRLSDGYFIPVKGAYHEILFEEKKINQAFWQHFFEFILV